MIEIKDCPKCGKPKERLDIIPIITDKLGEEVPEKLIEKVKYADIDIEISCKCRSTRINVQYEFFDKENIISEIVAIAERLADEWNKKGVVSE